MAFKTETTKFIPIKSNLKTGMCIEMRCGWRAFIMLGTSHGDIHVSPKQWTERSWGKNNIWKEDLTCNPKTFAPHQLPDEQYIQYDIVKVWDIRPELTWALEGPSNWQLMYEREDSNQ